MRNWFGCLVASCCVVGLTACGSSGSVAPTITINNLKVSQQVFAGNNVLIRYITWDDDGPDEPATSSFYADIDGDLDTVGDQIAIDLLRPNTDGVEQSFNWNTAGVPAGVYCIIGVCMDQVFTVETVAVGKVTVATFVITKPVIDRAILDAAIVDIRYTYVDSDSTPTTDVFADRDGNLGTTDDQFVVDLARPETGATQTLQWNTLGVDPGDYFIIFVNRDGAQGTGQFTANGKFKVVSVSTFSPGAGETLFSTAYNARINFSESLTFLGATINANTITVSTGPVTIPGTYTLENGGTSINFEPDAGYFPAPADIRIEVLTSMLFEDGATTLSAGLNFTTSAGPVFVTSRTDNNIAVMDLSDPTAPTQVDELDLDAGDEPYFSTCASDGMMYMSNFGNNQDAGVIVYDLPNATRVGLIPLPPVLGDNSTGASGIALSPDEKTIYCAGYEDVDGGDPTQWRPFLSVINRASMTETTRIQLNFLGWPRGIAVSPDGKRVYVANAFGTDSTEFGEGAGAGGPTFIGVVHVVDAQTNQEIDADGVAGNGISPIITRSPFPHGVTVSTDNGTLYVSHGGADIGEFVGLTPTPNISAINTSTFVEGAPLVSVAQASAGTAAIIFDHQRDWLYAPRSGIFFDGSADGLSIFAPFVPVEAVVDTDIPGTNNNTMRDVAIVWGTPFVVLADAGTGIVVVDVTDAEAVGAAAADNAARSVATIPPSRH